jgi:hypothetical protein
VCETRPILFSKLSLAEEGDGAYDESHASQPPSTTGPTNPGPMPAAVKRDYDDNPRNEGTSFDPPTTVAGNGSLTVLKN